ncbi:MAG: 4'-phosphopantetheinyl transferase superfamily protein [Acidobacteria bacterium]|nr:4'-phosphopantetheinyl transferase superfamily protein [Acidobacteriota bacterium]
MTHQLCWLTQTLTDVPQNHDWLSEGERAILAGMRFPKRRNDWLLGRWTAKRAICARQSPGSSAFSSIEIRAAADGAPEAYLNGKPAEVSFSISHSKDQGFCAVSPPGLLIGCDLEFVEDRKDPFVEDYFIPEEIAFCRSVPGKEALADNLIWSAKESMLKALRQGLSRDTRSVHIRPDPWEEETSWNTWTGQCIETSRIFHGWWRFLDGYVYTLASDQRTHSPEQLLV